MDIYNLIRKYIRFGYRKDEAKLKVAQDIILMKIAKSKYNKNVTIKGGVVMHSISKDIRRATRDVDIDFIKYSLNEIAINSFVEELNNVNDEIKISIIKDIETLHHEDYVGKRVYVRLVDKNNYVIETKLDIGVHKYFDIKQVEYFFDFNIIDESVSLLINSKEQIIVEKLKSLLKLGTISTRYKDIFDLYYLINYERIKKENILKYIDVLIFKDTSMYENNMNDVFKRLNEILTSITYIYKLSKAENWLDIPVQDVISNILDYFKNLI